ncbi:MAG TPA: glycerol-3-phosphate dehydrogenase/oxidase [Acidimicrobiia bacterium]|nr:glycerol-3-phosphate dehydrogenase/oxidase [Acidimicrobiia bacterium]
MTDGWSRTDHHRRLERSFDVAVIGGGITGAGAALDLAARGLEVIVLERSDFAQGTSSRSTKLFHGGIRYLPQFHLGMVSEGLREQKVLARVADFLFHPLEFVIPLYAQYGIAGAPSWAAQGWAAPLALRAGLVAYDVLGGPRRPGRLHRAVSAEQLLADFPMLRPQGLERGFVYSDAQTDDARLVISVLKTAVVRYGATAVSLLEVSSLRRTDQGFVLDVHDRQSGDRFGIHARTVLSAAGAFDPPPLTGRTSGSRVVRSKGTHLIAERSALGMGDAALVLPETDDGRVLYILPWLDHALIGTTDTPFGADPTHPTASPDDVDYLLRHVRRYLDADAVEPISTFAGLRALKDDGTGRTSTASREHVIEHSVPGYVTVAGGKLTTYRRIAGEAADAVMRALGGRVRSSTDSIPLIGAGPDRARLRRMLTDAGADPAVVDPTIARNGSDAGRIAAVMASDPASTAMLGDRRSSLADVVHAVRNEGASRITDVTLRRTHLAWFTSDHGRRDAPRIADVMAAELGWTAGERERQLEEHERELVAEGL